MKRLLYFLCLVLPLIGLLSGCATVPKSRTLPKSESAGASVVSRPPEGQPITIGQSTGQPPSRTEELTLPTYERPPEKPLPKAEPIDPKRVVHAEVPVMLNVEDMPLSDFIIYALGETLKITFVIDEPVKNMKTPITFRMTQEMPAERVLENVIGLLEKNDLIVEEKAGALFITKSRLQPKRPMDIRIGRDVPESPAEVLQVVPLRYIRPSDIDSIIKEVYKTGINLRIYPKGNALLLSGPATDVKEIVEFIGLFDVPYIQNKSLSMLKLTYWQTDEFINQLSTILEGLGFTVARSPRDPGILFIPIKFLNNLIVVAPDEESLKYVLDWYRKLDTAESAGTEEKAFTYTPKYSRASDLVDALRNLYMVAPPPAAPVQPPTAQRPSPQQPTLTISGLKISADDKRNLILILTTPAQYRSILSYLERLDVPPRQVLIEATIAELTLKEDLKYGLEWYIKNKMVEGKYTLQTLGQLGLTTATGLTYQFISDTEKFKALINAFAKEDRINILSSPRLVVLDNEEATIQIGTEVPIVTGEVSAPDITTGKPSIMRNIQYRTTGVILRVKPTINTEGLLTLNISQEVSEAQTNIASGIDSPMILLRRINTMVVAATAQSIILGGIMSETTSETENKVPLLGDIPVLGHLFKTTSRGKQKTELIILLTPSILTNIDDAVRVTNEFKEGLKWLK
ncbi:MAG: type II secretion system secretin GspD [Thermodesulfovibrionales bacterium]|nr:type II secretion system secretin GspD [Thermodesulfovibrionales bacterium]